MKVFDRVEFINSVKNGKLAFFQYYPTKVDAVNVYIEFMRTRNFELYMKTHFNYAKI